MIAPKHHDRANDRHDHAIDVETSYALRAELQIIAALIGLGDDVRSVNMRNSVENGLLFLR